MSIVLGCGPQEQLPQLETEHLSFHGELDGACEAFGRLYEREVDRIEHELGRELLDPVDVHIGPSEVEHLCGVAVPEDWRYLSGCVLSDTEVATTLEALSPQLVTVIRDQHGVRGIPFIEEALPYMFGVGRPSSGFGVSIAFPRDPAENIAPQLLYGWSDWPLVRVQTGVHFLHWVQQVYGSEPFQSWIWSDGVREGKDVAEAFVDATGQTIAVARERWGDESEMDFSLTGHCHGMPAPPLPAGGLFVEASPCCDDPSVEQHEPPLLNVGMECFTLPVDTEVTLEMLAGEGTLMLRADGCSRAYWPLFVELGEATTLTLPTCRWSAMVVGPEHCEEGAEIRYAITPS